MHCLQDITFRSRPFLLYSAWTFKLTWSIAPWDNPYEEILIIFTTVSNAMLIPRLHGNSEVELQAWPFGLRRLYVLLNPER